MNQATTHTYRRKAKLSARQRQVLAELRTRGRCRHLPFLTGFSGSTENDQKVREALIRNGWAEMPRGWWTITEAGIRALECLPPEERERRRCCACEELKDIEEFDATAAGHARKCRACNERDSFTAATGAPRAHHKRSFLEERMRKVFMEMDVHRMGGVRVAEAELGRRFDIGTLEARFFIKNGVLPTAEDLAKMERRVPAGRILGVDIDLDEIRRLQGEHGFSQRDLASRAGIQVALLNKILMGSCGTVAEGTLDNIAAALGVERWEVMRCEE